MEPLEYLCVYSDDFQRTANRAATVKEGMQSPLVFIMHPSDVCHAFSFRQSSTKEQDTVEKDKLFAGESSEMRNSLFANSFFLI